MSPIQLQLTAGVVSHECMREGSGGWRMIPGKDPTSARISGTTRNRGKNREQCGLQLVLHIKLEINVLVSETR